MLYRECGVKASLTAVKKVCWNLGWRKRGPKYFQAVREANPLACLAFHERCVETGETFDDVIFTDESSIWLERHSKVCFRKKGMQAKHKAAVKHPYKVHVWAGISKRGATGILVFMGIHEERVLCGQHPERYTAIICHADLFRWIPFSARQ